MQTTGAPLLTVSRCSPPHVRTPVQDCRRVHGLLYLGAVRNDSHHLIRSDLQSRPLHAYFVTDLVKYSSTMRIRRQWWAAL
jgi:hypothetical protein